MIFTTYTKTGTYYEFIGADGQKLIYPVSSIILTDDESGFIAVKNTASRQTVGLLRKEEPVPPTPTFDGKLKLILDDESVVSAECDSTSSVTSGDVSSQYSGTVVSAEIGNCVTSIGDYAFSECTSLSSCTIGSSVTTIGEMAFSNCTSLSSVTISDSITTISIAAFYFCISLTNIVIPSGVTSISDASFRECRSLTSVVIPDIVTSIGIYAFGDCRSLTSIDIPNSVTNISQNAFRNCSGLTSVTVNATTPPTLGSRAFDGSTCPIYVPSQSVDVYKAASGWSTYANRIQSII